MSRRAALAAALAGAAAGLVVQPAAATAAADDPEFNCIAFQPDVQGLPSGDTDARSLPMASMQVTAAHEVLRARQQRVAGEGWSIAVLDSGVLPDGVDVEAVVTPSGAPAGPPTHYHGTVVANLAAGDPRPAGPDGGIVGVAPGASVLDVRVFEESDDPAQPPKVSEERLVAGLEWVADEARSGRRRIAVAVVAHWMPRSRGLARAVREVLAQDVVVVASTGNRPADDADPFFLEVQKIEGPGEDAAGLVYPAGFDGVLGVGATAAGSTLPDAREKVLQSSAIDVVAPTAGAVSRGLTGQACALNSDDDVATSWAAAEVAGVVALLRSAFPKENRHQIEARLLQTASGRADRRTVTTGAGVVQPLEALTRRLSPAPDGTVAAPEPRGESPRATAPEPRSDLLAQPRRRALWVGLVGGGAVVLALVLRPLLSRRRG